MEYADTSVSKRYWMNTPHMSGGFNYAVMVGFHHGGFWQDMASHSTRGVSPRFETLSIHHKRLSKRE